MGENPEPNQRKIQFGEEERIRIDPIYMAEAKKKMPSKNKFSENLYKSIFLNIL